MAGWMKSGYILRSMQQQSKIYETKLRAQERPRSQKWGEGWGWEHSEEGRGHWWWWWGWGCTTGPGCWCARCTLSVRDSWLVVWICSFPHYSTCKNQKILGNMASESVPCFPFWHPTTSRPGKAWVWKNATFWYALWASSLTLNLAMHCWYLSLPFFSEHKGLVSQEKWFQFPSIQKYFPSMSYNCLVGPAA